MRGEPVSRPRKLVWLMQDRQLALLQERVTQEPPRITILEFLIAASHRIDTQPRETVTDDFDLVSLDPDAPSVLGAANLPASGTYSKFLD